jgi:hypothetical protein
MPTNPDSREAEIAARLNRHLYYDHEVWEDIHYLLTELQQARQERDEWKRRAEDAEGRIANALA